MKHAITSVGIAIAMTLGSAAADLAASLDAFATYRFGDSKETLHNARLATFRDTHDEEVRLRHERLILDFIKSDATVDARREAIFWLSNIGTAASVSRLDALVKDPAFRDVAAIARAEVQGKRPFTPSGDVDPSPPDTAAMLGEDERAARMALEAIAEGTAPDEARAWLMENLNDLPPHRQVAAMNALIRADPAAATGVITTLTTSDDPVVRAAAILALGIHSGPQDMPKFVNWLKSPDESVQSAAVSALVAAPEAAIREVIVEWLDGDDDGMQAIAINVAAQRGAHFAGDELLRIASNSDSPNQKPAISALAWASEPAVFPYVLDQWMTSAGSQLESEWQATTWALARRQPDYQVAIEMLKGRAGDAPQTMRAAIQSMAGRLESAIPEVSLDQLRGR